MNIILFDGVCNLCDGFVNFIIDRDSKRSFHFAAIQSDAGEQLVRKFSIKNTKDSTVIFVEGDNYYTKSTAVLRIVKHLSGLWQWVFIFIIIPPFIRNFVYDIIVSNRFKWFGKRNSCRIPTSDLQDRFL